MKVSEIFKSVQGEGRYSGLPALFMRLSGCNRSCEFCDTKYHTQGKEISINNLIKIIKKSNAEAIVWTGGEPALQVKEIIQVIEALKKLGKNIKHHLETNGDIIIPYNYFNYVSFSPKEISTARNIKSLIENFLRIESEIKIVTDLKEINLELIPFATMLMPLTTYDANLDNEIKKRVWDYCSTHNLKYSPRLHIDLFGKKKGI